MSELKPPPAETVALKLRCLELAVQTHESLTKDAVTIRANWFYQWVTAPVKQP